MSHAHHHGGGAPVAAPTGAPRIALVGSPNAGKTTLFNGLTGLRAKTGNYPGVTVSRYEGRVDTDSGPIVVEDLPGTYSLDPISPDEEIVAQVLDEAAELAGVVVVVDATNLRRGLGLVAQVQQAALPTVVVLTFVDELLRRGGRVDPERLGRALGVTVLPVVAGERRGVESLRRVLAGPSLWPTPPVLPPTAPDEVVGWAQSVLAAGHFAPPDPDSRTGRLDGVLLHPLWGTLIFFATMFAFFQTIFAVAAPLQGLIEEAFAWLGELARSSIPVEWLGRFVADAILAGVGGVLVFLPQIALLFVLISLLEGSGYLSRAAYLMDRVMASAGLEGRAFVALLSSMACAIPGIMATRTLPSAKDRLATMMAAPLMTCSARLPVYVLLIGMLVPSDVRWGPVGAQGAIMFGLYLLGAASAMTSAWFWKRIVGRSGMGLPFYMEMPSYRLPRLRTVLISVWDACAAFLRKITSIILVTTVILWGLLNLPLRGDTELVAAGVDPADSVAVTAYTLDHSAAAAVGRAIAPVFEPLGFDWRVNVGVISSLAAREVFVSTMGQVAAATDPENPTAALKDMTHTDGPRAGEKVFTPPTIAALLIFFVYAMQCMSTLAVMRRETGTWRWPLIAFVHLGVVAWLMAFLAHTIVGVLT
ncbi:ferrous iron transporter B [Tessaracoccus lapidicaptus]|uniref:Ferrous iron transporter B n=1 Tax=Tessaracoccus lapidicaptus TaxID=1427523 RepID=A0A1C0AKT4_9ACTN|nr:MULTISPECIES: ferrous iron transporter B [Tessaracoccus]AQX15966.1 ferrous iron transporter B [Tessaracoccus sp. T2.5-30]OCL33267.1 ferrous iron transporter B [Tessaracoccus lapidicaptus]VEP40447.1 Fe(2+) transporter FeoB [Tessaracoccus lapidicaptus]